MWRPYSSYAIAAEKFRYHFHRAYWNLLERSVKCQKPAPTNLREFELSLHSTRTFRRKSFEIWLKACSSECKQSQRRADINGDYGGRSPQTEPASPKIVKIRLLVLDSRLWFRYLLCQKYFVASFAWVKCFDSS